MVDSSVIRAACGARLEIEICLASKAPGPGSSAKVASRFGCAEVAYGSQGDQVPAEWLTSFWDEGHPAR
jgi:hypothetical protein